MKLTLLLFIILFSSQLLATLPPSIRAKRMQLDFNTSYYQTKSNYDNNGGSFEKIPRGRSYTKILFTPQAHYSLSSKTAIWGNLGLAYAKSVNDDFDRVNSNLSNAQLGYQFRFKRRPVVLTTELVATIPIYTFDENTDEVLLSEGVLGTKGGLWMSKNLGGFNSYIYTGIEYRGDGRSALFHWDIGSHWRTGTIFVGAEVGGFSSIQDDDDFADPTTRLAVINNKNGGSLIHYSINPEILEADLWGGLNMGKGKTLRLGYNQTLNGKNYAAGQKIIVAFRMNLEAGPKNKVRFKRKKDSDEFIPESEKYDESLFDDTSEQEMIRKQQEEKLIEELSGQ